MTTDAGGNLPVCVDGSISSCALRSVHGDERRLRRSEPLGRRQPRFRRLRRDRLRHSGRRRRRQHPRLAHRLLRAQPAQVDVARSAAQQPVAPRPADLQHEHQLHLQRLLERLVGELLPQRRRLLQHRRARRRVRPRVGPRHGQQRRQRPRSRIRAKASPTSTPRCGSTTAASAGTSPPATAAATAIPAPPAPASARSTGRSTPRTPRSPWRTRTPPAAAALLRAAASCTAKARSTRRRCGICGIATSSARRSTSTSMWRARSRRS